MQHSAVYNAGVYYPLAIWRARIFNVPVPLFIYARSLSQTRASLDGSAPNGSHVLLWIRSANVQPMLSHYGWHMQARRTHSATLISPSPSCAPRRQLQTTGPTRTETGGTWMSLTGRSIRAISIRYVENYEQSCSCLCKPTAQPSSAGITTSWPHGGAVCAYSERMRLCNVVTANRELPY